MSSTDNLLATAKGAASGLRAVILAGGKGTRLAPFTATFPKPLVPLGDQPVIEVLVNHLTRHGITDITLTLGHLGSLFRAYFSTRHSVHNDVHFRYVTEEQPTGTAGSLASVPELMDTFLVMNGDVLTTLDLHALVAFHRSCGASITIAAHRREVKTDFGVLEVDGEHCVTGYREKPTHVYDVSMGVYVYEPDVLRFIERGQYLDFPDLVVRLIRASAKVCAYPCDCLWLDIGRPDDYARAQEIFADNKRGLDVG